MKSINILHYQNVLTQIGLKSIIWIIGSLCVLYAYTLTKSVVNRSNMIYLDRVGHFLTTSHWVDTQQHSFPLGHEPLSRCTLPVSLQWWLWRSHLLDHLVVEGNHNLPLFERNM